MGSSDKKKKKKRKKGAGDDDVQVVVGDGEVDQAKAEALQKLMKIKELPKETRLPQWRALLRAWHPDKNPDKVEIATAVFQFLQKGRKLISDDEDKKEEEKNKVVDLDE